MSDDYIYLIPEAPHFVPRQEQQRAAQGLLGRIAPDAEEIKVEVSEKPAFFDCAENFERILCPSCRQELSLDWFAQRMGDDFEEEGFKLAEYSTPCCNASHTLHDLVFEWPQGFGRFALEAMNPNIGVLDEAQKAELEAVLGTRLRVIYQHI